jgi:hypothetical protein
MSKFRQHVPNFVDIDEDQKEAGEFHSQEELLAHPWIASWAQEKGFFRYSLSPQGRGYETHLMAEFDEGKKWWVLGYLSDTEGLSLPKWKPVYE